MRQWTMGAALFGLLALPGTAAGQGGQTPAAGTGEVTSDWDDQAPDEDWVWEDGHEFDGGRSEEGFYRPREVPGVVWSEAHYDGGRWVPGRFVPTAVRPGQTWVVGHRGPDGYWVVGHWRPVERPGWVWVPRAQRRGVILAGHWVPTTRGATGHLWTPGHYAIDGTWVDGHWRPARKVGFTWSPGHWRYGRWVEGAWQPKSTKGGHVWVRGHWRPGGAWVDGYWRALERAGHHWVVGRFGERGAWVPGRWVAGAAPKVTRRHRLRPVAAMRAERKAHRRQWRNGRRQERTGEAQIRRGERIQERGERMEARGAATGNERLEDKGQRKQDKGKRGERRGERNVRKGQRKQK